MEPSKVSIQSHRQLSAEKHQADTWDCGPSNGDTKSEQDEEEDDWGLDEAGHLP